MTVFAQVDIGATLGSPLGVTKTVGDMVTLFLGLIFMISGITVFFLFLFGGFKIISSAGQNDPRGASDGKQALTAAFTGFIVIFVAFWIVRLIEITTGTKLFITGAFLGG